MNRYLFLQCLFASLDGGKGRDNSTGAAFPVVTWEDPRRGRVISVEGRADQEIVKKLDPSKCWTGKGGKQVSDVGILWKMQVN